MTLRFAGTLDHAAVVGAVDALVDLVSAPEVRDGWDVGSALPGMTIGGLVRHLVSQPECAVEFLRTAVPPEASVLSLEDYADRLDWLAAGVDDPENTSICEDFNEMAGAGPADSLAVLERSRAALPAAVDAAGATVYVPWQDCALGLDDFLVVRLLEVVVHADDLAVSIGRDTPRFDDAVLHPVAGLLATLSLRRHGQGAVVRALSRAERANGPVSAFG